MSLLGRVRTNLSDMRLFGPMIVTRHLARLRKDRIVKVRSGDAVLHVRAGESDLAAFRQVFGQRDYDLSGFTKAWRRLQDRYEEIVRAGDVPVVVDAGANIGAAAIWFEREYPEAAIVAVEPDPGNASILRMNAAGRDRVHVVEAAIGSERGHVSLSSGGLGWAVQTARAATGVPVVTIDDAVARVPGGVPFVAKIDIEGFERDLFASNLGWIDGFAAIMIEPHDWMLPGEYTSVPVQRAMGERRFEMYHRGENIIYLR